MAELRSLNEAEAVELTFEYTVTEEFIETQIEETGFNPGQWFAAEFSLPEVPANFRMRLLRAHQTYEELEGYPELMEPSSDIEVVLPQVEDWISFQREQENEAAAAHQADIEAQRAEAEAFDRSKNAWIAENGSTRLRRAAGADYKVNRTYATERGAVELPEFWIDTAGDATWRERTDPTEAALNLEASVHRHLQRKQLDLPHRIVWLLEPPRGLAELFDEVGEVYEADEAVIVFSYLGRYVAVAPLDPDLRNPADATDDEEVA